MIPDRWQVDCVLASMMRGGGAVPDEAFAYCPQETGTASCRKFAGDGRNTQVSILSGPQARLSTLRDRFAIYRELARLAFR